MAARPPVAVMVGVAVALGFVQGLAGVSAADLPFVCPRNDPKLPQCVGNGFVKMIHSMLSGKPEWHVPKLDPMVVPLMFIPRNSKVMNMNLTFIDMKIIDIAKHITLKSINFNLDKMELTMLLNRPNINFSGKYKINGSILYLPIWGSGTMSMSMKQGVEEVFKMTWEKRVNEAGKQYLHVKDYSSSMHPHFMRVKFNNLFAGNRVLGRAANALLNSQWKIIFQEIHPVTDGYFSRIMKPHWTEIFKSIPIDEAFPVA